MASDSDDPEWRSDEEASRLRDEALARLLKTPPTPEERLGRGKSQPLFRRRGRLQEPEERLGRGKSRRAKERARQPERPAASRTSG